MKKSPVLVVVDATPRWIYGITPLEVNTFHAQSSTGDGMQLIHLRLNDLMCEAGDAHSLESGRLRVWTTISIDLEHIHRIKWSHFRGHELVLCGVYGDACVAEAGEWLRQHGHRVTLLVDACLWGFSYQDAIAGKLPESERIMSLKRAFVRDIFPALTDEHAHIWNSEIPEL